MGKTLEKYKETARQARIKVIEMIFRAQSSHVGSNLSVIDILTFLFEKMDPKKDKLIVSKGWVAASVYYFLAEKGVIPKEDLERYCGPNEEVYIGLVEPHGKFGLEFAGGSMGYGTSAAVGFGLAKKLNNEQGKIHVLMSDGEMQVGTVWESVLIAKQHSLSNIVAWVDNNRFQAMGPTKEIVDVEPIDERVKSFGWAVQRINGHDFGAIEKALGNLSNSSPNMIICDTIKGKGVSFMENNNLYHYKMLSEKEYENALKELG